MERQRKRGREKNKTKLETCTHSVQHATEWEEAAIPAVFPHLQGTWRLVKYWIIFFPIFLKHGSPKKQKPLSMTQWGVVVKHQKQAASFRYRKLSVLLPPSSCLHSVYQQGAKPDRPALREEMFYLLRKQPALARREGNRLTFLPLFLFS